MFYRFMEQENIDWRKLAYMVSLRLLTRCRHAPLPVVKINHGHCHPLDTIPAQDNCNDGGAGDKFPEN